MGTSVHFRGQQCARIQVHGAVTLKTQSPDNTRKNFCDFKMSGEQLRQPKDLQGLLKFCMEATANEDAPAVPADPAARLAAMEPERRAWLEEALDKMSVDMGEQLGNGIKVLLDGGADLETKEEVLDCLEDWLGTIDMACNFHKIGGFVAIQQCLDSPHASLRSGGAHLVGEIGQNNPYCQQRFLEGGFFIGAVATAAPEMVGEMVSTGLVLHLAALLEAPHELSHEHVLRAMLTLVQGSSAAKSEARSVQGLSSRLEERLKEVGGREEGEESEDYCRQLLKELKLEEGVDR